jgi:hypothetical protein
VPRRRPNVVRRDETICRTHERTAHDVPGLSPSVIGAITVAEHGQLVPGFVSEQLRLWQQLAKHGGVYRPGSNPCGIPECCGYGPRGNLEMAIGRLPARARSALRQVVRNADEAYLSHTLPDPLADPQAPWWERRRPIGWP